MLFLAWLCFCDRRIETDWKAPQNPSPGFLMVSFSCGTSPPLDNKLGEGELQCQTCFGMMYKAARLMKKSPGSPITGLCKGKHQAESLFGRDNQISTWGSATHSGARDQSYRLQ